MIIIQWLSLRGFTAFVLFIFLCKKKYPCLLVASDYVEEVGEWSKEERGKKKRLHVFILRVSFLFVCLFAWFFFFWDRGSLCSLCWPGIHSLDQTRLKIRICIHIKCIHKRWNCIYATMSVWVQVLIHSPDWPKTHLSSYFLFSCRIFLSIGTIGMKHNAWLVWNIYFFHPSVFNKCVFIGEVSFLYITM